MSAVDASAVLSVIFNEPDAPEIRAVLAEDRAWAITAVNYWEVIVGAERRLGSPGVAEAEQVLLAAGVGVASIDASLAREAAEAFRRFKSRANGRLNLEDSFAYALAKREGGELLYKGDDFARTDVSSALHKPPA